MVAIGYTPLVGHSGAILVPTDMNKHVSVNRVLGFNSHLLESVAALLDGGGQLLLLYIMHLS